VAGITESFGAGNWDMYLVKTDANGDAGEGGWIGTFGGTERDYASSVQQTTDGGYIVAGYTYSFDAGNGDVYLIKTDQNGNGVWSRTFGGTEWDCAYSAQQTTDGGYILAGQTVSFDAGYGDVYLIKTDANGDQVWTRTFGGTDIDGAESVQQTTDGGYIVAGSTGSFGARGSNVYLIKADADGSEVWSRTFGGVGDDKAYSVQQTSDGGYIAAGSTRSFGAGELDAYLIKTDANGDEVWSRTFGGSDNDCAYSVQQTTDGGYIVAGHTYSLGAGYSDVYLTKTDGNGDGVWSKTFGGSEYDMARSVQQTNDGGYILAGQTGSFGEGGSDVYLIKTDANGNAPPPPE
jgi:hypothetical protein